MLFGADSAGPPPLTEADVARAMSQVLLDHDLERDIDVSVRTDTEFLSEGITGTVDQLNAHVSLTDFGNGQKAYADPGRYEQNLNSALQDLQNVAKPLSQLSTLTSDECMETTCRAPAGEDDGIMDWPKNSLKASTS